MLSVLTLVKNRPAHLHNLLSGLVQGSRLPDEVVVVVMGGTDPEPEIDIPNLHIRYLWMNAEGLPLAQARNLAASATDHQNLVFLDVDCIPSPQLISSYEKALVDNDALYMGPVYYLEVPINSVDQSELEARARPHPDRIPPVEGPVSACDRYELFWSLSFALRKTTWDGLGGFDERFTGYGAEDTDFAYTAREQRLPLLWVRDALAFHQYHHTYDPPLQHFAAIVANAKRFKNKWGTWPMEGWLSAFAKMSLIEWSPEREGIEILRAPLPREIEAANVSKSRG
jgi:GT2 family glycosyltransferase